MSYRNHQRQSTTRPPPPNNSHQTQNLKSITDFIDREIPIHIAESQDLQQVLESTCTLMLEVAVDSLDTSTQHENSTELVELVNTMVNQLGPALDLAEAELKCSDLALNTVLAQLQTGVIPNETDGIYDMFQKILLPPLQCPALSEYTSNTRSQLYSLTKNPVFSATALDHQTNDDELVIMGETHTYTCPITMAVFEAPIKSKTCGHFFEESAIRTLIRRDRARAIECPVAGCEHFVSLSDLVQDKFFKSSLRIYLRQQQQPQHRSIN